MNKIDTCKKCTNRKFDPKQGIICGLTNAKPAFEDECPDFNKDETVKEYQGSDLKPNEQRAKILLLFIWIVLVLEIVSLISSLLQYNLLQIVANGGEITSQAADANDMRELIIALIYLIAYLISAVAFILWFRRAYYNLHQKVEKLSFEEGWAAGSWFVPVVNLFRPYQIMKELYVETRKFLSESNSSLHVELQTGILGLWWTLWIISGVLGQIIFRVARDIDTLEGLISSTVLDMVGSGIGIILAIVTVRVIKNYADVEGLLQTEGKFQAA